MEKRRDSFRLKCSLVAKHESFLWLSGDTMIDEVSSICMTLQCGRSSRVKGGYGTKIYIRYSHLRGDNAQHSESGLRPDRGLISGDPYAMSEIQLVA